MDVRSLYEAQAQNYTELSSAWTPKWNSIVGYWKMDGNWQDSSGNSFHGTAFNGPVFDETEPIVGSAAGLFDGFNDIVKIPHDPKQNLESFTISHWVKKDGVVPFGHTYGVLVAKGDGTSSGNNRNYLTRVFESTGKASLALGSGSSAANCNSQSDISGEWHHFVGIAQVKGADTLLKVFVDGVLESSCLLVGETPFQAANGPLTIGTWEAAVNYGRFPGKIDDISLWGHALNDSEVSKIYNRQKQKYAGSYDSEVIDSGGVASTWPYLTWSTNLPFGKGLVGDFNNDGNPDSESSSDYSGLGGNLGSGLVGYWKFNETMAGNAPGGGDFEDFSGRNNHGIESGGVGFHSQANFGSAVSLDGVDDFANLNSSIPAINGHQGGTLSMWFKKDNGSLSHIFNISESATGNNSATLTIGNITTTYSDESLSFSIVNNGTSELGMYVRLGHNRYADGQWHHVVVRIDGVDNTIFIDGVEQAITFRNGSSTTNYFTNIAAVDSVTLGARKRAGLVQHYHKGVIDESSIWSRPLSNLEVQQLYRRGVNRVELQVKSCVDSSCNCKSFSTSPQGSISDCDGDGITNADDHDDEHIAQFFGPGGDGITHFSELLNRPASEISFVCDNNTSDSDDDICVQDEILLGGSPKPTGPEFLFAELPESGQPEPNRYFQYRVNMEADENIACAGEPCLPDLTSVSLSSSSAPRYFGQTQVVNSKEPFPYKSMHSATIIADACATFQLSRDESVYYQWDQDQNKWDIATNTTLGSAALDISSNIQKFSDQFGPGNLFVRAFLASDTYTECKIEKIEFSENDFSKAD